MKLVTCMGGVWQLTDAKFRKLTQFIAAGGEEVDMDEYGKFLGTMLLDVTDIDSNKRSQCRMLTPGYPEHTEFQKVKAQHGS